MEFSQLRYAEPTWLLITADYDGGNGAREQLWKTGLQTLVDQTGLSITVVHRLPDTGKWNHVEYRLFAFITQNWRRTKLLTHQVNVQLIADTTTQTGLAFHCRLDKNTHKKGVDILTQQIVRSNITQAKFHSEGNYAIVPRTRDG